MGLCEEEKKLSLLCADCKGRCCMGHHILLSDKEFDNLKKKKNFPSKRIDSPTGCAVNTIDALTGGRCPFLAENGCTLKPDERPLICRLYPLTPIIEENSFVFYFSSLCPHLKQIREMRAWIKKTKKEGVDELSMWNRKEAAFLGKRKRKEGEKLVKI